VARPPKPDMFLFLVHHGDAVGPDVDPQRPLSTRGRMMVDLLARQAATKGARPEAIWHSGKLRARQTAEAYWRECNPLAQFSAKRGLQPTDPAEWVRDLLEGEVRDVMLVGHMPNLARVLRLLLGEDPETSSVSFPLNGAVALKRLEPDQPWTEAWRLSGM
jgi:phosphohistidine phosphatase